MSLRGRSRSRGNDDPLWRGTGLRWHSATLVTGHQINGNTMFIGRPPLVTSFEPINLLRPISRPSSLSAERESQGASRNAPSSPTPAIHQMCQISAKAADDGKNALTEADGAVFGISIGAYSGPALPDPASRVRVASCSSSRLARRTRGRIAKFLAAVAVGRRGPVRSLFSRESSARSRSSSCRSQLWKSSAT